MEKNEVFIKLVQYILETNINMLLKTPINNKIF